VGIKALREAPPASPPDAAGAPDDGARGSGKVPIASISGRSRGS